MTGLDQCASLLLVVTGPLLMQAVAQSLPADVGATAPGVGFSLPRVGGSLSYALTASESISTGFYNGGASYTTNFSGDLGYVSKSQFHPFSAVYAGGVLLANSGQPTTFFQNLSFSQVLSTRRWNLAVADSISYLPESPVGGLSGVPGVGDLGVDPVTVGSTAGIGILTTYGPRISNSASGTVGRQLSRRVTAQGTGSYSIQRFLGDNSGLALNSTAEGGSAGLSYHFSARDTITGNYNYSTFSYSGANYSFSSQGATIEYGRQWSRRFGTDVYVGPQIIGGSGTAFTGNSVQIAAGATASYLSRTTAYSLGYNRGVNNGSGVIAGSFSDSLVAAAHRQFGRSWIVSGSVGFSRSTSLPNFLVYSYDSKGVSFGAQGTRALGRRFAGFLSYTVQDQASSSSGGSQVAPNAFNGVYQVVGLGISYSPRNVLLGK